VAGVRTGRAFTIGGEARQAFEGIEGTRCDEKVGTRIARVVIPELPRD
jgi:hypothetical protein